MYENAMEVVRNKMVTKSVPSGFLFLSEVSSALENFQKVPVMEHLACFAGGMLALGQKEGASAFQDFRVAEDLTSTCHHLYSSQPTGLAPDAVHFHT